VNHRILTVLFGATATLLAAGTTTTARADADQLLEKVSIAEGSAAFVDVDRMGGDRDLADAVAKMQDCMKTVDQAVAGGVAADTETRVYEAKPYQHGRSVKKPGYTAKDYAPVGEIKTMCEAKLAQLRVLPARWGIEEVIEHAEALAKIETPRAHAEIPAKLAYDRCLERVALTVSLGAPASEKIVAKDLEVTVGEAKDKGCGMVLPAIEAAVDAAGAANDARFAPYKKALHGDQWQVFKDKNMIHFKVFGRGGRELATPAQLAASPVWFEHLETGTIRRWSMRRFQFDKKGKLISTRTVSGAGRTPPGKAHR